MVIETEDRHRCGLEVCRSALEKGQRVLRRGRSLLLRLGVFIRLIHCQSHINGLEIRSFFFSHSNTYPATLAGCATGGGWRRCPSLPLLLLLALRKGGFPTLDQDYFYGSSTSTTVAFATTGPSQKCQPQQKLSHSIRKITISNALEGGRRKSKNFCSSPSCLLPGQKTMQDADVKSWPAQNHWIGGKERTRRKLQTEMATFNRTEGHSKAG